MNELTTKFDWTCWPEDLALRGGLRLPTGKLGGILTDFQRKVNKKFLLLRTKAALRREHRN
jgi:hypothetical protein